MTDNQSDIKEVSNLAESIIKMDLNKSKEGYSKKINRLNRKMDIDSNNLFSTKIVNLNPVPSDIVKRYVYKPINFSVDKEEQQKMPQIYSWVERKKENKLAFFRKFNIKMEIPKYTTKEYTKYIAGLDKSWSKEETDHLLELLELFEGNFSLVKDRYSDVYEVRDISELKERIFMVCQKLAEVKEDDALIPYSYIKYNKQAEQVRRAKTEKYLKRKEEEHKYENKLINEIKNIEGYIKQKERENKNFKKIVEFNKDEKKEIIDKGINIEDLIKNTDGVKERPFAFNRGTLMRSPLPNIMPMANKKLELALSQLGVPETYIATENNLDQMDLLKKKLLKLFSLNFYYQQKEEELKNMTHHADKMTKRERGDSNAPAIENLKKTKTS